MDKREILNDVLKHLKDRYTSALLSQRDVARELKVSQSTVIRMREGGEIKANKVGNQWRYSIYEIARIIAGLEDVESED